MRRISRNAFFNIALAIVLAGSMMSCSPSKKLNGDVTKGADTSAKKPAAESSPLPAPLPQPATNPVPAPKPEVFVPDDVVDGQEVIKDCKACMDRATTLAASIGFTADKKLTTNVGFYKIDPAKGLCDIHFKKKFFDRIQDHEGEDSILEDQIALYCPCDCGWGI